MSPLRPKNGHSVPRALAKKITTDDLSRFCHDAVETGMVDQHRGNACADFSRRKIGRGIVVRGDRGKRGVNDAPAFYGITLCAIRIETVMSVFPRAFEY